jgi:hypothetical protein
MNDSMQHTHPNTYTQYIYSYLYRLLQAAVGLHDEVEVVRRRERLHGALRAREVEDCAKESADRKEDPEGERVIHKERHAR